MFKKYFLKILLLLILLIIGIIAYFEITWIAPKKEISELEKEINGTIHTEADIATQCEIIPIGSKACGGPEGYRVYSTKTTDIIKLHELTSQYSRAAQRFNKKHNVMSTCNVPIPPKVILSEGICTGINDTVQF